MAPWRFRSPLLMLPRDPEVLGDGARQGRIGLDDAGDLAAGDMVLVGLLEGVVHVALLEGVVHIALFEGVSLVALFEGLALVSMLKGVVLSMWRLRVALTGPSLWAPLMVPNLWASGLGSWGLVWRSREQREGPGSMMKHLGKLKMALWMAAKARYTLSWTGGQRARVW